MPPKPLIALSLATVTSDFDVRRAKAVLSSGANPIRQTLQPEAIGAVMEVTSG